MLPAKVKTEVKISRKWLLIRVRLCGGGGLDSGHFQFSFNQIAGWQNATYYLRSEDS